MKTLLERLFRRHVQSKLKDIKRKRAVEKYSGKGVECLICKSEFKSFAPFAKGKRPNAKCPNCGSLERHRMLFSYMKSDTDFFDERTPKKLLHFAPEPMFQEVFMKVKSIEYYPVDLVPEKYGETVTKADITDIPFEDGSFDLILCNHVLEHVPDDAKAMRELYRVTKKGGWGIFQVPVDSQRKTTYEDPAITSPSARKKAYGRKDHVRWYGLDFSDRLRKAGFEVQVTDLMDTASAKEISRYGFKKGETIYHCRKM